jgi:hypothetical protein
MAGLVECATITVAAPTATPGVIMTIVSPGALISARSA